MATSKVTLVCTECLSRNYTVSKNKNNQNKRLEVRKHCPKCNRHTLHKEAK